MANPEHLKILHEGEVVWNAWRKENPNITPDLRYADLAGANLTDAKLQGANLHGAILSKASARGAKFSGASLFGADLTDADLSEAWLQNSYLKHANLRQCKLARATLYRADLSNANLTGSNLTDVDLSSSVLIGTTVTKAIFTKAIFNNTVLGQLDLSTAKGLELAEHRGPSTIGINTIIESKGKIPETFLRGAGVPEDFIQYAATVSGKANEYYSCFISYNHEDKAFAQKLYNVLQNKGIRCWLDEKNMVGGDGMHQEIDEAIRQRDKVLLCCSENSLKSGWVEEEFSKAIQKEEKLRKERGKKVSVIIPLDLDGFMFKPEWENWKQSILTDRVACKFKGWENDNGLFEREVEKVIKALRADSGSKEKHPKPRL